MGGRRWEHARLDARQQLIPLRLGSLPGSAASMSHGGDARDPAVVTSGTTRYYSTAVHT